MFKNQATKDLEKELSMLLESRRLAVDKYNMVLESYKSSVSEKWEYLQVHNVDSATLNQIGYNGWELVSTSPYSVTVQNPSVLAAGVEVTRLTYTFKRRLATVPDYILENADIKISDIQRIDKLISDIENQLNKK